MTSDAGALLLREVDRISGHVLDMLSGNGVRGGTITAVASGNQLHDATTGDDAQRRDFHDPGRFLMLNSLKIEAVFL